MARLPPAELLVTAEEVRETHRPLPRMIHEICYVLGITNDEFAQLYEEYHKERWKDAPKSAMHPRLGAQRGAIKNKTNNTFYMLENTLEILKMRLVDMTYVLEDKTTGKQITISLSDTIDMLDKKRKELQQVGIDSL